MSREASPKRSEAQGFAIALCIAITLVCVLAARLVAKENWLIAPIFISPFLATQDKKKR
jgi:hypothetical protein